MAEPAVPTSVLTAGSFVVAFVVGVTPGKWARVWAERMPQHPLILLPVPDAPAALAALLDGSAHAALTRLPVESTELSAIPLYEEQAVVVVPKEHPLESLDSVVLADLTAETVLDDPWPAAVELVAANVGVAIMPQSVARALSRRDVVARPVTDAATTHIALVWPTTATTDLVEEFTGIVRGRSANSSRGRSGAEQAEKPAEKPAGKQLEQQPRKQPEKRARPPRRATQRKRSR